MISALYGGLYAIAVLLEVAYRFDLYGTLAVRLAPAVFGLQFLTCEGALLWNSRAARRGKNGLFASASLIIGSALALQLGLRGFLPSDPITEAVQRQSQTAQAAYLKDVVLYFLPLGTIYILLPFHVVTLLRRQLLIGNGTEVLDLLSARRPSAIPGGVYNLRVSWLGFALFCAAIASVFLTQGLLDHLKPGPYMNLFMILALLRTFLYFTVGVVSLLWYAKSLNEIRRQCLDHSQMIHPPDSGTVWE